jgi:hypothetical protein
MADERLPGGEIRVRSGDAALLAVIAQDDERPAVQEAVMRILATVDAARNPPMDGEQQ